MGKYGDEEGAISEHGNWNVASEYSRLKIMKLLYLADEYEMIATFGTTEIIEELTLQINKDVLRINGMKRLIKTLIMLINNTIFAVKDKDKSKATLKDFLKELKRFWKVIPTISDTKVDQRKGIKQIVVHDKNFNIMLDRIIEIKSLINEPLNKYDLIFSHKEEWDPSKMKAEIIKKVVTRG